MEVGDHPGYIFSQLFFKQIIFTECTKKNNKNTLERLLIILGKSPASITACTWGWLPAVIFDKNQTASYKKKI